MEDARRRRRRAAPPDRRDLPPWRECTHEDWVKSAAEYWLARNSRARTGVSQGRKGARQTKRTKPAHRGGRQPFQTVAGGQAEYVCCQARSRDVTIVKEAGLVNELDHDAAQRAVHCDWGAVASQLDNHGNAVMEKLLS